MPPSATAAASLPRASLAAAIAISAIAAALRFWQSGESLWLDELHTAWCAVGDLAEVAPRAASGNQSPLFFWLEWLLVRLFGESEFTLRLPSLLAGSLLPLALFALAWRWMRSTVVSLTAAALLAVDHSAIFYATEARPYALVQLLAVLHIAIAAELPNTPSLWLRFAWVGLAALLFHLHYTAALLIPAELAYLLAVQWAAPSAPNYRPTMLLIDVGMLAVLYLPAVGNLQSVFARRENWAAFVHPEPLWHLAEWFPASLSVPFVLVAVLTKSHHRRAMLHALAWLLVPATIAWLATTTDLALLFFPRYLAASASAAILLAACSADLVPQRWSRWLIGGELVVVAVLSSGIIEQVRHDGRVIGDRREDWRGALYWLNKQLPQHSYPVLVASGLIEADALRKPHDALLEDYCLFPVTSLYPIVAKRVDLIPLPFRDSGPREHKVRQLAASRGGAWLVVRGSPRLAESRAAAITGIRRRQDPEWNSEIVEKHSFGNVQIILLREAANPEPRTMKFSPH